MEVSNNQPKEDVNFTPAPDKTPSTLSVVSGAIGDLYPTPLTLNGFSSVDEQISNALSGITSTLGSLGSSHVVATYGMNTGHESQQNVDIPPSINIQNFSDSTQFESLLHSSVTTEGLQYWEGVLQKLEETPAALDVENEPTLTFDTTERELEAIQLLSYLSQASSPQSWTSTSGGTSGGTSPYLKICSNCGCTETPSWRRDPDSKKLVCNACGLYKKLHGKNRLVTITKEGAIKVKRDNSREYICTNCGTLETPLWRKGSVGMLCNACGLYYKTHGMDRPLKQ